MKKKSIKILSLLLTLTLMLGLLPGMSLTAYAVNVTYYDLWVGNTWVTSTNMDNVLGDGTVSFTPAKGDTPAILALSGATIAVENGYGIEYTGRETLNIVLNGENKVSSREGAGIYCRANLSISGGGSLTVSGSYYGIYCDGTLDISNGSVGASGNYDAILSYGPITISGGTVTADAQSVGIASSDITISGGTVTATGSQGNGIYSYNTITISGGTVTAIGGDKAIIGLVKNSIPGTGWTDTEGTKDETEIPVSAEPRDLSKFKKVEFIGSAPSTGYTVTYVANNGTGATKEYKLTAGETHKVQGQLFPAPDGMEFNYWLGDDGKIYRQEAPITETRTLTAQWTNRRGGGGSGLADVVFNIPGADGGWEYIGGGMPQRAYRLSLAPMQGGSAYFLLNSGENGETMNVYPQTTVRVVPTPAPGYRLASIVWSMIDGSASYDITESQTFVMPAMDAVVYVTFQPIA